MRERLKRISVLMLAVVLAVSCMFTAYAENRQIGVAESGHYIKVFENKTKGGTLYIKDLSGNVLNELKEGDRITYRYPDNQSPDEVYVEAVADSGYAVDSYTVLFLLNGREYNTCESVSSIREKKYARGHFLASAKFDESFSVSFVQEAGDSLIEENIPPLLASSTPDIRNPKTGDIYTGEAVMTYDGKKNQSYNGKGYITCTSGEFVHDSIVMENCASGHDYWAPQTGQTGVYTVTIVSVDKTAGIISCVVSWANNSHEAGYQNLSGTFSYYHSFDGTFSIRKGIQGSLDSLAFTSTFEKSLDLSAVFTLYSDKACKNKVAILKTNRRGEYIDEELSLAPGTYYLKETKAPKGFALNPTVFTVKIGAGAGKQLTVKDNILRAKISGVKVDAKTGKPVPTGDLSLAGAVYTVYEDAKCTKKVTSGKSDEKGNIEFDKDYFACGTYWIKETEPPEGYDADPEVHKIVIDESLGYYEGSTYRLNDASFTSRENPQLGDGRVIKKSLSEGISNDNACYTLAGCEFQLTSLRTGKTVPEVLVTDAEGKTNEITLPTGEYIVREIKAPKGFTISDEEKIIIIKEDVPGFVEFYDEPANDPISILVKKVDKETGETATTGAGELAGAQYTIRYYDGQYETADQLKGVLPVRSWVMETDKDGKINFMDSDKVSGDEFYLNSQGQRCFPLGTVTLQETKAPEGYLIDDTLHIQNITADFKGAIVRGYQTPVSEEPVIRGDLKGLKVSGGDMKRLSGVPFKITSVTTGESHIVVTDKNGMFDTSSSWNLHSANTNRGETAEDGIWFGSLDSLDDNTGAMPYGEYTIEELSCEANRDKILLKPFTAAVTKHNTVVDLGTLVNEYIPVPAIGTRATDKNTGIQAAYADKQTTIVDEVDYTNLSAGREYTLKGILMDKQTEKPLLVNGREVEAEKTFTAERSYGTTALEFMFDSSDMQGRETVVFERLYHGDKEIAAHADIKDRMQTVRFASPELKTSATDKRTGKRESYLAKETTIIDEVSYSQLITGREYTVKGVLMDKQTEKPLLINGREVTAEKTFIAQSSSGTVKLIFTFDSSDLGGKKTVAFERLYYEDKEIAVHTDIEDENQTVKFSEPKKTPDVPKTGESINVFVLVFLLFLSAGFFFILMRKRG